MTSLIRRYILRETLQTWLVVTLVLLLILITNQFASVVGDAAANKLPRAAIMQVLGLTTVQYLTILIPVGYFLAIMLALARLYHDSEMAAMMACGVGPAQLYRAVLTLGLCLAVLVGVLALVVSPQALRQVEAFAAQAKREASIGLLEAGRFVSFADGEAALYAESITPDRHLHGVFVQRRNGDRVEVIVADEAWQEDAGNGIRVLTFARGHRYEGEPGDTRFRQVDFAEHGIPFALPTGGPVKVKPQARSSAELLASADLADRAEFHWRLGVPLTLLVLTVVAVPLAKTEPRSGRFSGLASAVLVYLIYANLLAAGRGWLERGQVPEIVGLWWVHGLFLTVGGLMLFFQLGLWRRWRRAAMA
ncbi:MAG: LPS export ABC transporter permease LptF [Gammaproteobacteria bacterium]|nr:LPS export ABC transporter permease LptF [Gammaproteobacteria bacterium]